MLHVISTRLHPGHLSVHVGDSSQRSEETKNLELCLSAQLVFLLSPAFDLGFILQWMAKWFFTLASTDPTMWMEKRRYGQFELIASRTKNCFSGWQNVSGPVGKGPMSFVFPTRFLLKSRAFLLCSVTVRGRRSVCVPLCVCVFVCVCVCAISIDLFFFYSLES